MTTAAYDGARISAMPLPSNDLASISAGTAPRMFPWYLQDNAERIGAELARVRDGNLRFNRRKKDDREELSRRIRLSAADRQAAAELAAYREFEIYRDVLAIPFAMAPFQSINLSADELPLIRRPKTNQYFTVRYMGQDGGWRQDQWRTTTAVEQLLMDEIGTDRVEFPLRDIQIGNIEEFDRVNQRLRFDMEMKIDALAKSTLDAGSADSGLRALLKLHPQIIPANIPDKNHLDLTDLGYGPANTLTLDRIKAILAHVASFGVGVDPDGGMNIQSVVISPQNVRDQWDFVDLVSTFDGAVDASNYTANPANLVPTPVREQIFNQGVMNKAWGQSWSTVPNGQLDKGRLYVFTNLPVGWFFTKSEFDTMIRWDGPDQQDKNYNAIAWKRVIKFAMPAEWAYRYVIVDF